ncbi:MAG: class I SAM-dependent methyltransferase, partial [Verrucomicrobiia bacterium]
MGSPWWGLCLEDELHRMAVTRGRLQVLRTELGSLLEPEAVFAFLCHPPPLFPSHQISSEICGFIRDVAPRSPKVIVEIGTAMSGTNFLLGHCLPSVELILALDLQPRNQRLVKLFQRPGLTRFFLRGPSAAPETLASVQKLLGGRTVDLLFIDGDHAYAGVKADFDAYWPLVTEGGVVAFHDIVPDHKTRYGQDTGNWAGDVPRFWQEIKAGRRFENR